jgi:uncharacterized phiE125 gp8 family phage protein
LPVSIVEVTSGDVCSLEEIRQYVQVPEASDNALLQSLSRAAVEHTQSETRRKLLIHTMDLWLDKFPGNNGPIRPPFPPLKTVEKITYIDADGDEIELDEALYLVDTHGEPGRITPADGESWPAARATGIADHPRPVRVQFTCGYGTTSSQIPDLFRTIIKGFIKLWFDFPTPVELSGAFPVQVPMHTGSLIGLAKDQTEYPPGTW